DYLDFGSVFDKSESQLAAANRRVGEYFLLASGGSASATQPAVPQDNGGWMVQAMYFSMGKKHDYRPALKYVSARALVILGEGDAISDHGSRTYAGSLPNAKLEVLKTTRTRGGHF